MILLGLVPILCSGLLGLAAAPLRRRLSPSLAAPLLALAALATSLATGVVLCLAGFLALARNPLVASVGGWSAAGLRPWRVLPATWAAVAGLAAAVLLVSAVGCLAHAICDLVRASRACDQLGGAADRLRISPDDHPAAFTVPLRGAIVVSAGMLRLLPADERRALLAHEHAHLRRFHAGYVMAAALAAAANPLLRPVARQVRLAVELWADRLAAEEVGDGRVVARALARASLAATRPPQQSGLSLAAADTDVSTRVRALLSHSPRFRPWAAAAAVTLALASGAVAVQLTADLHGQVEMAQADSARVLAHRAGDPDGYAPRTAIGEAGRWTSLRVTAR
jgi:Zn-dependent protease with chaperone function